MLILKIHNNSQHTRIKTITIFCCISILLSSWALHASDSSSTTQGQVEQVALFPIPPMPKEFTQPELEKAKLRLQDGLSTADLKSIHQANCCIFQKGQQLLQACAQYKNLKNNPELIQAKAQEIKKIEAEMDAEGIKYESLITAIHNSNDSNKIRQLDILHIIQMDTLHTQACALAGEKHDAQEREKRLTSENQFLKAHNKYLQYQLNQLQNPDQEIQIEGLPPIPGGMQIPRKQRRKSY